MSDHRRLICFGSLFLPLRESLLLLAVIVLDLLNGQFAGLGDDLRVIFEVLLQDDERVQGTNSSQGLSGLVTDHGVFLLGGEDLFQDTVSVRVLHLTQDIGQLVLEKSRLVSKS